MSGMDRLTDAEKRALESSEAYGAGWDAAFAAMNEIKRRASQVAPAPSDHLVSVGKASGMVEARVSLAARQIRQTLRDYGHRCAETSLPDLIAADVDAALRKQDEIHAPAPSDGLREENERLRGQLRMIVSHATMGATTGEGMSVNDISVKITALRNEMYQAGKDAAMTPAPAQEGGE